MPKVFFMANIKSSQLLFKRTVFTNGLKIKLLHERHVKKLFWKWSPDKVHEKIMMYCEKSMLRRLRTFLQVRTLSTVETLYSQLWFGNYSTFSLAWTIEALWAKIHLPELIFLDGTLNLEVSSIGDVLELASADWMSKFSVAIKNVVTGDVFHRSLSTWQIQHDRRTANVPDNA